MKTRVNALADRLERGALALGSFASSLTDNEWQIPTIHDGRKIGVVVHHVASMYPIEIDLAQKAARGEPIVGVTWDVVNDINTLHARKFDAVTKQEALDLLESNSTAAAEAIRALSDDDLDVAVPLSLNDDAPLTCQFVLEDHAVRHAYHHLAAVRTALQHALAEF
jgi:DinB superfamily